MIKNLDLNTYFTGCMYIASDMAMQNQYNRALIACLCIKFLSPEMHAQFVDVSNSLMLNTNHTSGYLGTGVSFADFNGDDLDDLTFGHHGGQIRYYQGDGLIFEEVQFNIDNDLHESKSVLWADIDNDGDQDFLITNRNASNKLWMNQGDMEFLDATASCGISTSFLSKSYGASFGDYDNDGFIDLYICNYHTPIINHQNELYHNNGDGTFTDVTMISGAGNGLQQSFQSTWIDIDHDGFLDLHVINDRVDFKNSFYHNNGDGTFIDMADVWGADLGIYAMSSTFGDYDNDGDMDVYVTNGQEGNKLLANQLHEGMGFVDVTNLEGVEVQQLCWGACFIDSNNNRWKDLYVATGISVFSDYPNNYDFYPASPNAFFSYSGISPMQNLTDDIAQVEHHTFAIAKGDFNSDGFPDLVSHQLGINASVITSIPTENHFVKIRPQGTIANRDAIGAEVKVYHSLEQNQGANGFEVDVVFCGDKYLSQNSRHLQFGLGSCTQIDSVQVTWPGGSKEVFTGVLIDTTVVLIEGTSTDSDINDECPDPSFFCGNNTFWDETTFTCISIFNEDGCPSDVNNDGFTNVTDLLLLLLNFGTICAE